MTKNSIEPGDGISKKTFTFKLNILIKNPKKTI